MWHNVFLLSKYNLNKCLITWLNKWIIINLWIICVYDTIDGAHVTIKDVCLVNLRSSPLSVYFPTIICFILLFRHGSYNTFISFSLST